VGIKSHPPRAIQREGGRRIRKLREKKRLKQTQLAELCGMSSSHLGNVERGNHNIRLSRLVRLANHLDTTVARLLRGLL